MTTKSAIIFEILFLTLIAASAIAQVEARAPWILNGSSLTLSSTDNPSNPNFGQSAVLALSYEKVGSGQCQPVIALLSFQSMTLGSILRRERFTNQNERLQISIGGRHFEGQQDTVLNYYTNGIEIVSNFTSDLSQTLFSPTTIIVSTRNSGEIARFTATNGIGQIFSSLMAQCELAN